MTTPFLPVLPTERSNVNDRVHLDYLSLHVAYILERPELRSNTSNTFPVYLLPHILPSFPASITHLRSSRLRSNMSTPKVWASSSV